MDAGGVKAVRPANLRGTAEVALRPGQRVRVHGLQSAAGSRMNGALGSLMRYDAASARWDVRLDDWEKKAIKTVNLEIVAPEEEKEEEIDDDAVFAASLAKEFGADVSAVAKA